MQVRKHALAHTKDLIPRNKIAQLIKKFLAYFGARLSIIPSLLCSQELLTGPYSKPKP
jgi:hypothetical protein